MDKKVIIGIGVVALILIVAGIFFFSDNSSNVISLKPSVYNGDVSNLVFSLEELPEGYSIAERALRLESDVSDYAKSIGWKEGYYIRYLKGEGLSDISRIEIYLSRYPLENISKVLENQDDEIEGYTIESLPNPRIGDDSIAVRYTDNDFGLRDYSIEFYKKDIYVRIDNGGTATDYEMLKELAQKLDSKI